MGLGPARCCALGSGQSPHMAPQLVWNPSKVGIFHLPGQGPNRWDRTWGGWGWGSGGERAPSGTRPCLGQLSRAHHVTSGTALLSFGPRHGLGLGPDSARTWGSCSERGARRPSASSVPTLQFRHRVPRIGDPGLWSTEGTQSSGWAGLHPQSKGLAPARPSAHLQAQVLLPLFLGGSFLLWLQPSPGAHFDEHHPFQASLSTRPRWGD